MGSAYISDSRKVKDAEQFLRLLRKLEAMQRGEALELATSRLLRSRVQFELVDRVIDLGIALEIMLMHSQSGTGDGKNEITNKISTRGGWLLGQSLSDRISRSSEVKQLYTARSLAVHTGTLDPKKLKHPVEQCDALVVEIINALLDRGSFPNWDKLVFGGSD